MCAGRRHERRHELELEPAQLDREDPHHVRIAWSGNDDPPLDNLGRAAVSTVGPGWRNGRRGGLKSHCPKGRAGSNPAPGTVFWQVGDVCVSLAGRPWSQSGLGVADDQARTASRSTVTSASPSRRPSAKSARHVSGDGPQYWGAAPPPPGPPAFARLPRRDADGPTKRAHGRPPRRTWLLVATCHAPKQTPCGLRVLCCRARTPTLRVCPC